METHKLMDRTELAEGDFYATKGFIADYGNDFQTTRSTLDINQLRKFDVNPYVKMPFDELRRHADGLVRNALKENYVPEDIGAFRNLFDLMHCMEEPPVWLVKDMETKALYSLNYKAASELAQLVDTATFKKHMSEKFYQGMFQLMIQLLKGSEISSVLGLLRVFSRTRDIDMSVNERPYLKEHLNIHVDGMSLADLWTIYKVYEKDAEFCKQLLPFIAK